MSRAPDVADLEKMLDDGKSDDELCDRAIEIVERLRAEARRFRYSGNTREQDRIEAEGADFANVIEQIDKRRHPHALDRFKEYIRNLPNL